MKYCAHVGEKECNNCRCYQIILSKCSVQGTSFTSEQPTVRTPSESGGIL